MQRKTLYLFLLCFSLLPLSISGQARATGSWTPIGPNNASVFALTKADKKPLNMLAGTFFGGLYETGDGGQHWRHLNAPFSRTTVFTVAYAPGSTSTIYAGTFDQGLFKSDDGGSSWQPLSNGLRGSSINAFAIAPDQAGTLLAATDQGLFRSTDGGLNWQQTTVAATVRTLAFAPGQAGIVYAGTLQNGILRSPDHGQSWQPLNQGLGTGDIDINALRIGNGGQLLAASNRGAYRLPPGQNTWQDISFDLPTTRINELQRHPGDGSLLAATDDGIYRLASNGRQWTLWGAVPARSLLINSDGSLIYVAATFSKLLATSDDGASFFPVDMGIQNSFSGALLSIASGDQSILYSGSGQGIQFNSPFFSTTTGDRLWQNASGLSQGVFSLTADPLDPSRLYAGTEYAGVWKSTDWGSTWQSAANGIIPATIYALSQSPKGTQTLYAATSSGLYISRDGGSNWQPEKAHSLSKPVRTVLADPTLPGIVYFSLQSGELYRSIDDGNSFQLAANGLPAGDPIKMLSSAPFGNLYGLTESGRLFATQDHLNWYPVTLPDNITVTAIVNDPLLPWRSYLTTTDRGVYRTSSAGISWQAANQGMTALPFTFSITVNPQDGQQLYAGTIGGIYFSRDGADSWQKRGQGIPAGGHVTQLAVDPRQPQTLYASVRQHGVYRSDDNGLNWQALANGTAYRGAYIPVAISTTTPTRVFVGSDRQGIQISQDNGATFSASNTGMSLFIRSVAIAPQQPATLYAASLVEGMFRSDDGGSHWRQIGLRGRNIFDVQVGGNPDIAYAATSRGVARTNDGGLSWQDLGQRSAFALSLSSDASNSDHLLIGSLDGKTYHSLDGGSSWLSSQSGLPKQNIVATAINPTNGHLLAAPEGGGLYLSRNQGLDWQALNGLLATLPVTAILVQPLTGKILVASKGQGVLSSTDDGNSWQTSGLVERQQIIALQASTSNPDKVYAATSSGLAVSDDFGLHWRSLGQRSRFVFSLLSNPGQPGEIVAGGESGQLSRSLDQGRSWQALEAGLPKGNLLAQAIDSRRNRHYVAIERAGVYRSDDHGRSWSAGGNLVQNMQILAIHVDDASGRVLLATNGHGLFTSDDAGQSWQPAGLPDQPIVSDLQPLAGTQLLAATSTAILLTRDNGNSWSSLGQQSAFVFDLLRNPNDDRQWFIGGASGEVWRSDDAGKSWSLANTGLPKSNMIALSMSSDGHLYVIAEGMGLYSSQDLGDSWQAVGASQTALATATHISQGDQAGDLLVTTNGHGLFLSHDHGLTWRQEIAAFPSPVLTTILPDPQQAGRYYLTTASQTATDPALFVSQDNGLSWQASNHPDLRGQIDALAVSASEANTLIAVAGGQLFRSVDAAGSWQILAGFPAGYKIRSLRIDDSNPLHLLAGTLNNGLLRSQDGGLSWQTVTGTEGASISRIIPGQTATEWLAGSLGQGLFDSQNQGLDWTSGLLPGQLHGLTLALASDAQGINIYASIEKLGVIRSQDGGRHWQLLSTGLAATDITALLVDPLASNRLYAASSSQGIYFSQDGGLHWQAAQPTSGGPLVVAGFVPGSRAGEVYAATLGQGLVYSSDGGSHWQSGFQPAISNAYILAIGEAADDAQTLFLSSENHGVFSTRDGGLNWSPQNTGLPADSAIDQLMISTRQAPYTLLAGSRRQGIFISRDGGQQWQAGSSPYTPLTIRAFAGPQSDNRLLAATAHHGLLYSRDQGNSWQGGTRLDQRERLVTQITLDPTNDQVIYAAASGEGLIRSSDGGASWQAMGTDGFAPFILALLIDPQDPATIYIGSGNGVYVSEDGGQNWQPLNNGLFNTNVTSLAVNPLNHYRIYVGTEGGGVFEIDRTPPPVDSDGDGIADDQDCAPQDPRLATLHTYYYDYDQDGFGGENIPSSQSYNLPTIERVCALQPASGQVIDSGDPTDFDEYQFTNIIDKLGRRFAIDMSFLPESGRFPDDVFLDLAPDASTVNLQWSGLERTRGDYSGPQMAALQAAAALARSAGIAINLSVNPIQGQFLSIPTDLQTAILQGSLAFDATEVIQRFNGLLDQVHTILADIPLTSLQIGYEIDDMIARNRDPAFWTAYRDFFAAVSAHAKSLWGSALVIAPTWTARGFLDPDLLPLRQLFDPVSDMASITYLPRQTDYTIIEPEDTTRQLTRLVESALPKPLYIQALAYPSAVITGSSTTKQSQFLYRFFRFWDAAYLNIPFVSFGPLHDLPANTVASGGAPQPPTQMEARQTAYQQSLGLRQYAVDGLPKPAYNSLRNLVYTRGWWRDLAQQSRDYLMGFTTATFDLPADPAGQLQTFDWLRGHLQSDSDITLLHFDGGVPWVEAFNDDFSTQDPPYSPAVIDTLRHNRDTVPAGNRLAVSINPLGVPRHLLAPYWGVGEGFGFDANFNRIANGVVADDERRILPPPWDSYDFASPQVRQAYLNYCRRMLDYFQPEYLVIGIEVSAALVQDPVRYEQYFALHKYIYNALKNDPRYAHVPIMVSFSATSYMIDEFGVAYKKDEQQSGVRAAQIDAFERFLPYTDIIGLSLYPHFGKYKAFSQSAIMYDELFAMFERAGAANKPIAITESGYTADVYDILDGFVYTGSEEKQRRYHQLLFRELARHSNPVEFVINFKLRDSDLGWQRQVDALPANAPIGSANFVEFLKFFRDIGIYDGNGRLRSGGQLWQEKLALPYLPSVTNNDRVTLTSPDGQLTATIFRGPGDRLFYTLRTGNRVLLEASPMGITVDGKDLGSRLLGLSLTPARRIVDHVERLAGHRLGITDYQSSTLTIRRDDPADPELAIDLRLYNDGLAFRYQIPGQGPRLVSAEATAWQLPARSLLWYQNDVTTHRGIYRQQAIETLDDYMSGIVTSELFAGGYLAIGEAGLEGYSRLTLQARASANRRLQSRFPHDPQWRVTAGSFSPWRFTLFAANLNTLINSDLIHSLAATPASSVTTASPWLIPGRALWPAATDPAAGFDYLRQREYISYAGILGFRYVLLDPGWEIGFPFYGFPDQFAALRALVNFAHAGGRNVDIVVWKDAQALADPILREQYLGAVATAGATAIRVAYTGFGDQSSRELEKAILAAAARHQLQVIIDQGTQTVGENRTYPHLMARAGLRGLAWPGGPAEVPASHNTALPFTRQLSGPTDYKVVSLDSANLGTTTLAHQLAMSGLTTSPIQTWVGHPFLLNSHPELQPLLATLPTVWDESIVLPGSSIGGAVAIARRSGQRWFLFAANGDSGQSYSFGRIDLGFLGNTRYQALVIGDDQSGGLLRIDVPDLGQTSPLSIDLLPGGGFVTMLTPIQTIP